MTAAVTKIVKGQEEVKRFREYTLDSSAAGYVNFNSTISTGADWYAMIPQIAAGTNNAQKIGNSITPSKLQGHWNFRFATADALTRSIEVTLYIVTSKQQKAYPSLSRNNVLVAGMGSFLDQMDGVNDTYYDGTWNTSTLPINKELFTLVKKHVFRLTKSSGLADEAGVVGQYDGNGKGMYCTPGTLSHKYSYSFKKVPKLKYDINTSKVPSNFAPMWACGYRYLDGTAPDSAGGLLIVDFAQEIHYRDD